jgi:hypothetical protein
MKSLTITVLTALVLLTLSVPVVCAAGAADRGKIVKENEAIICYEADVREDEEYMKKTEALANAGKFKEAFAAAVKGVPHKCLDDRSERTLAVILKTYKKLGQQAEKAGRFREAFEYYYSPYEHYYRAQGGGDRERESFLPDAHRAMLEYAKSKSDDIDVVTDAVRYFENWEKQPLQYKEAMALAEHGGKKALEKEAKEFAAHKYQNAVESLKQADQWFALAKSEKPVYVRAKQRLDALLTQTSYEVIERAMDYTDSVLIGDDYQQKANADARARADRLGAEAERKGDLELAERFYGLSGNDSKHDAVAQKITDMQEAKDKQQEQAEDERQQKFATDQKALEKELGF